MCIGSGSGGQAPWELVSLTGDLVMPGQASAPHAGKEGRNRKTLRCPSSGSFPKEGCVGSSCARKAETLCVSVCQPQSGTGDVYAPLIHLHPEDSRGGPLQRL